MSHHSPRSAARAIRATGIAALAVALLATPAVAAAEAPLTTVDTFDRSFAFDCPQGFQVLEHYNGTETIRRFDDGRQLTHVRVTSEFTNASTGETLRSVTPFLITFEIGEWVAFVGPTFRVTAPGAGVLAIDAGRLVFDWSSGDVIFDQGPSDGRPNLCVFWGD